MLQSFPDWVYNVGGHQSPEQEEAGKERAASDVQRASKGRLSHAQARAAVEGDMSAINRMNDADVSQRMILIGAGILAALLLLRGGSR